MKILALDVGKIKTVACWYETEKREPRFVTVPTTPQALHDLVTSETPLPSRVVLETGNQAGWIVDMLRMMGMPYEVANVNDPRWRYVKGQHKNDRRDALRLAEYSSIGTLTLVHVPKKEVRQWRSLIAYRAAQVYNRTRIKNRIRSILDREGLSHSGGKTGWTGNGLKQLSAQACKIEDCLRDQWWTGMLDLELTALAQVESLIATVEGELDRYGSKHPEVQRLQTIPGIGPRMSELVVAILDDPHRFKSGKEVGAYAGLVPQQMASGQINQMGRITKHGNGLMRALLVEISWAMQHPKYGNAEFKKVYSQVCRGSKVRRKKAAVAVARRVLITCWAMLRDQTEWDPGKRKKAA